MLERRDMKGHEKAHTIGDVEVNPSVIPSIMLNDLTPQMSSLA